MEILDDTCSKYSSPISIWGGPNLFLLIHDPDDVDTILKSSYCQKRIYINKLLREGIHEKAEGLFTLNG